MTPVFAYYADLISRSNETDVELFDRAVERLMTWFEADIGGGYKIELDGVERFQNPILVSGRRDKLDALYEHFTVKYQHPNRERTLLYRLVVDLVRVPQGVQFALKEEAHTLLTGMEPLQVVPYLPGLLKVLAAGANLQVLGENVPTQPQKLEEHFVGRFVDTQMTSPTRVLPIIALSPHPETGRPIVAPEEILMATYGLAHIADLLTKQSTFEISNALGREWSCYNGALRIYWPNLVPENDQFRRHPIYFPDHYPVGSQAILCTDIFRRLAAAALVKFSDPPKLKVFRQATERAHLAKENARIVELTAGVERSKELTALLQQLQKDRDDLKRKLDDKDRDLVAAQQLINEQVESRTTDQQQWADFGRQLADAERAIDRESRRADAMARRVKIENVHVAATYAREDFGDVLRFLPSADKSADESPFARPEKVYELFRAMANLQRTMRSEGSLGTNLFEAFKPYGFEYKDKISMTAATKFGSEYTFNYEGMPTLFEHHVTIGSGPPRTCISVHWIHDERTRHFVIGWCGNHLTNTRT